MTIERRYKLETGAPDQVTLFLVGCGGTGSFAALHLAQFVFATRQQLQARLVFIDPDVVEEKNVGRQNFAPGEIGQPKARALARRYGLAYGLEIVSVASRFEAQMVRELQLWDRRRDGLSLIVGCVDNQAARRDITKVFESGIEEAMVARQGLWWLDAGNDYRQGQILLGNCYNPQPLITEMGVCFGLPLPSVQEPELVASPPLNPPQRGGRKGERPQRGEELSCAELTAAGVQARTINKMMATWLDVYVERMLVSRDLDIMATYLDQRLGVVSSRPITGGQEVNLSQRPGGRTAVEAVEYDDTDGVPWAGVYDPEEIEEILEGTCPECGGDLYEGRDIVEDEETNIYFCPQCNWRMLREDLELMRIEQEQEAVRNVE